MLIQFRVKNFGSIRDEAVLDLGASSMDEDLAPTHLHETGVKSVPRVVRSAVVYGPNASGKSTLVRALQFFRGVIVESATTVRLGQTYNLQPFRLDPTYTDQPSEFELTFVFEGLRHQYAFALNPRAVIRESLVVFRSARPTTLFSRETEGSDSRYEFSSYLTGPRKVWQESTRLNSLFLSTAANLNSSQLGAVFSHIKDGLVFIGSRGMVDPKYTTALLSDEKGRSAVQQFMAAADFSISSVDAISRKGIQSKITFSGESPQATHEETDIVLPLFKHSSPRGSAVFELQEESEGTQRIFGLLAPVLQAIGNGQALIVDELDSSLHTLLVRRLISMFHDPELNNTGAQLLFTTHDTSLLDDMLFRRDQVWFTERGDDHATRLFPLTDFSPRKHEAWERGYLAGRYGAVPVFVPHSKQWKREVKALRVSQDEPDIDPLRVADGE